MESSAAHMIIKALTLGGLSEADPPPISSPVCRLQSLTMTVIRYFGKTTNALHKERANFMGDLDSVCNL